jgi:hypothetical protein
MTGPMTDWSAARHELRKGRLVAWQMQDRLLNSERTAIRKAWKAHVRQREHLDNMREPYDAADWLAVAA